MENNLGKKRSIWLSIPVYNPLFANIIDRNSNRACPQTCRNASWRYEGTLFTGSVPSSDSASFLKQLVCILRNPCSKWVRSSYINHQSGQSLTAMTTGKSGRGNSSIKITSSQLTLGCVKWTIKANKRSLNV